MSGSSQLSGNLIFAVMLACCSAARADVIGPRNPNAGWLPSEAGCRIFNLRPLPDETVTWSGACVDNWAEGEGVVQWLTGGKPGQRYVGAMVRGLYEGHGSLQMATGEVYEGIFVRGLLGGLGKLKRPNGGEYDGEFVDGKFEGQGQLRSNFGTVYDGAFLAGQYEGEGTLRWPNGARYEGGFRAGYVRGKGAVVYADGRREMVNVPESQYRVVPLDQQPTGVRQICSTVVAPDMPVELTYSGFRGELDVQVSASVVEGKVTATTMRMLKPPTGPRYGTTLILSAVDTAMRNGYVCSGTHALVQEFIFKLVN